MEEITILGWEEKKGHLVNISVTLPLNEIILKRFPRIKELRAIDIIRIVLALGDLQRYEERLVDKESVVKTSTPTCSTTERFSEHYYSY
jgi:hypothetical protein